MHSLFSLAPVEHEWPRVTIIVPTKPGQAEIPSVEAARQLDYPHELIDVIVARGRLGFAGLRFLVFAARIELMKSGAAGAAPKSVHRKQQIQNQVPGRLRIRVTDIARTALRAANGLRWTGWHSVLPVYTNGPSSTHRCKFTRISGRSGY